MAVTGKIHSIQTLGTLDGPGVRFVIFTSGCNLRCGCCHNPDTWDMKGGKEYTPQELVDRALRYRSYFGKNGGVTVTGGEPVLQAEFVKELFTLCHAEGINTCLDTSGSILTDGVREALAVTDRVLLDVKYTDAEGYKSYVGCDISAPLSFLEYLDGEGIRTTLRQVVIPTLNDSEENLLELERLIRKHKCIDTVELLPFKKICSVKYADMGIPFPFEHIPTPELSEVKRNEKRLNALVKDRK